MLKPNLNNIRLLAPGPTSADAILHAVNTAIARYPEQTCATTGWVAETFQPLDDPDNSLLRVPLFSERQGNTRLSIRLLRPGIRSPNGIKTFRDIVAEIMLPFDLLIDGGPAVQRYSLYHIRFHIETGEERLNDASCAPLQKGYFGITKRYFISRVQEHYQAARNGTGFLLHNVWGDLLRAGINMHPVIQYAGTEDTLKSIYALEERAVAMGTLAPKGLNAIPGGEAGIRMLHELSLLSHKRVSIDERDAAVKKLHSANHAHGSPCAHYRSGHMRKLPTDRMTYVSPCWVNMKAAA